MAMKSRGERFTFKVAEDDRGMYLQMYKLNTTKMQKSLLIEVERLPSVREGEAWVETNVSEIVCFILLEEGLLTGNVLEVSEVFIRVQVGKEVGSFPAKWPSKPRDVSLSDEVRVDVVKQQFYVISAQLQQSQSRRPVAIASDVTTSAPQFAINPSPLQLFPSATHYSDRKTSQEAHNLPPFEGFIEISEAQKADFHRSSDEDFQRSVPEVSKTIGRHRLPIESLQWELMWSPLMVQRLQALSQSYSNWRRSKGDGNCFYRCLGVLLLEHWCRPDTPLHEFHTGYSEMVNKNRHFVLPSASPQDSGTFTLFFRLLQELYNKRTRGENAFQHLQYYLQCPEIDKAVIIAMRQYTASYLQKNYQHPDLAPFSESLPTLVQEITDYGREAEGIALIAAARCFSVVLHSFAYDSKSSDITETVYGPESPGWRPSFSLLRLPGHYHCLIRREVHERDRYDFASNTYYTSKIVGYEFYP